MGKPTICIGENKDADQLCGNREADQRLCFRYTDGTIHLVSKSKISSFYQSPVIVQVGLCRTCSKTTLLVFPRDGSFIQAVAKGNDLYNFVVYNQVRHKSGCTVIQHDYLCLKHTLWVHVRQRLASAALTSTHNVCFGPKIRKLGIPLQTPVFLYKGVYCMDMLS